jgi:ATP synthase protein I
MASKDKADQKLSKMIEDKEKRKLKEKRKSKYGVLKGLGMLGLIGWTVAFPTLAGTYLGIWLDDTYPSKHSWTLTCLISGLILGCWGAWFWLLKEKKEMQKEEEDANGTSD